jgi:hypothetical protein
MKAAPAAMLTILTLLVSSGCLRNVLVWLRLPLLIWTMRYRSSTRSRYSLSTTSGLAARECIRVDWSRGWNRRKILKNVLLSRGRVCSNLSTEAGVVALWGVALRCFEHGREVAIAVEEVRTFLRSLRWGRRT